MYPSYISFFFFYIYFNSTSYILKSYLYTRLPPKINITFENLKTLSVQFWIAHTPDGYHGHFLKALAKPFNQDHHLSLQ